MGLEEEGVEVRKLSRIYETEPLGGPQQPKFLNGVIQIYTSLGPRELLCLLQKIENDLGRKRIVRNGPRTIDLDILTYGDEKFDEPGLKIPHPRMEDREFVMRPLRDLQYESI